jgi:hypothetical protein
MDKLDCVAAFIAIWFIFTSSSMGIPQVEILKPHDGDEVTWLYTVEGNSQATNSSGLSAYVLIWPIKANGPWWVQQTKTYSDGTWESHAYFGRDPAAYPLDIGTTYQVTVIVTRNKLKAGETFNDLPIESLSERSNIISVKRI